MTTINQEADIHAPPTTVTTIPFACDTLASKSVLLTTITAAAAMEIKANENQQRQPISSSKSSFDHDNSSHSSDKQESDSGSSAPKESESKSTRLPEKETSNRNTNQINSSNHQPIITTLSGNAYPRGWSQLNIDFIESITAFLPAREICCLHRTCHAWLHIADHIRTPHLYYQFNVVISNLVHSLIRRHVNELVLCQPLTSVELELIARHLPKLQQLGCFVRNAINSSCATNSRWIFPAQLKELEMGFDLPSPLSEESLVVASNWMNQCLIGVSQIHSLQSLHIYPTIHEKWLTQDQMLLFSGHPVDIQPLTRLVNSLNQLRLDIPLTTNHMMVLRSLVNLISLVIDGQITHQDLSEFLADPMPFRLEKFILHGYSYTDEDVPLLKRLTHLTTFEITKADLTDVSFLSHMVQLKEISIDVLYPESLFESLAANPCQYLTSLDLGWTNEIRDQDLTRIFSHPMPVLKKLRLWYLLHIESLAFMALLSTTLEELSLDHCISIEPKELVHLRFLPHLRRLDLRCAFSSNHPIDSFTLRLINPNSEFFQREWFPALTNFWYQPTIDHHQEEEEEDDEENDNDP